MTAGRVSVLVISGSMGSGKTTVLGEASDILTALDLAHAAIDLDALGVVHVPGMSTDHLEFQNLTSVWANYAARAVPRLLLAVAVESVATRDRIAAAIPGAEIVVCRLRAKLETMQQRVRLREPGMLQETFVARTATLEAALDRARVEDFAVDNDDRPVTAVAREILQKSGWAGAT